mgnify:CR=1 FL=1
MALLARIAIFLAASAGALFAVALGGYVFDAIAEMVYSEQVYNEQGSAGRASSSSADVSSSPTFQRTTGDR